MKKNHKRRDIMLKDYIKNKPKILTNRLMLRELKITDVDSLNDWII